MEENKKKRTQAGKLQKNGEIAAKRTLSKKSLATGADEKTPTTTSKTNRGTASNLNVSHKKEDINGKFSMRSDSERRELTPQQQEFF